MPSTNGVHAYLDPVNAKQVLAEYEESDGLSLSQLMDSKVVSNGSHLPNEQLHRARRAEIWFSES